MFPSVETLLDKVCGSKRGTAGFCYRAGHQATSNVLWRFTHPNGGEGAHSYIDDLHIIKLKTYQRLNGTGMSCVT